MKNRKQALHRRLEKPLWSRTFLEGKLFCYEVGKRSGRVYIGKGERTRWEKVKIKSLAYPYAIYTYSFICRAI